MRPYFFAVLALFAIDGTCANQELAANQTAFFRSDDKLVTLKKSDTCTTSLATETCETDGGCVISQTCETTSFVTISVQVPEGTGTQTYQTERVAPPASNAISQCFASSVPPFVFSETDASTCTVGETKSRAPERDAGTR